MDCVCIQRKSPTSDLIDVSLPLTEVVEPFFAFATGEGTVNSVIFARTLFSRNFACAKFRENKTLAKWHNHSVVY